MHDPHTGALIAASITVLILLAVAAGVLVDRAVEAFFDAWEGDDARR